MSEAGTVWKRLKDAFRSESTEPEGAGEASASENAIEPLGMAKKAPWWRRGQVRAAQTREMSRRLIALADAMQDHFHRQDERSAALAASLERVCEIMEQVAKSQDGQTECLKGVATQTESIGKHAATLGDALSRVPDSLLQQAEAIRTVARQLDVAQESDTQLLHSLQQFGRAVDTLNSAGTAQVESLQKLGSVQKEQHETLAALVREQSRRFMILTIISSLLGLAGLAALIIALVLFNQ